MKRLSLHLATVAVSCLGVPSLGHALGITLESGNSALVSLGISGVVDSDSQAIDLPDSGGPSASGNTSASVGNPTVVANSSASYSLAHTASEVIFTFDSSSNLDGGRSSTSYAKFQFVLTEEVTYTVSAASSGRLSSDALSQLTASLQSPSGASVYYLAQDVSAGGGTFTHQLGGPPDGNNYNDTQGLLTGILEPGTWDFLVQDRVNEFNLDDFLGPIGKSTASATLTLRRPSTPVPDAASTLMLFGLALAPLAMFTRRRAAPGRS